MKTIRLLYPDYLSGGGIETYYFGAKLLSHILPENKNQPLLEVALTPPNKQEYLITDGIYAKNEVINGIHQATKKIEEAKPDKIITIGGDCIVSLAPFDYLHGVYDNLGIIWIDAHPDVSSTADGYPNAHAMVLRALLGQAEGSLSDLMKNKKFDSNELLYVGLQEMHDYQKHFLENMHIDYSIQNISFLPDEKIKNFAQNFDHILIHLDIDVLDPNFFHSTYFANKELVGDGSHGGKMTIAELSNILNCITNIADVVGFTIAEYLPFDEYALHNMLKNIDIFNE